jgi:hypothetical protein
VKLALLTFTTLILSGCSQGVPTIPAPTPTASTPESMSPEAWVWVMVIDGSGVCVEGATVQVVSGQGPVGESITQDTPCNAWSDGGVAFRNLTEGVGMTLRASASGYTPQEKTVIAASGVHNAIFFEMSRIK